MRYLFYHFVVLLIVTAGILLYGIYNLFDEQFWTIGVFITAIGTAYFISVLWSIISYKNEVKE